MCKTLSQELEKKAQGIHDLAEAHDQSYQYAVSYRALCDPAFHTHLRTRLQSEEQELNDLRFKANLKIAQTLTIHYDPTPVDPYDDADEGFCRLLTKEEYYHLLKDDTTTMNQNGDDEEYTPDPETPSDDTFSEKSADMKWELMELKRESEENEKDVEDKEEDEEEHEEEDEDEDEDEEEENEKYEENEEE